MSYTPDYWHTNETAPLVCQQVTSDTTTVLRPSYSASEVTTLWRYTNLFIIIIIIIIIMCTQPWRDRVASIVS